MFQFNQAQKNFGVFNSSHPPLPIKFKLLSLTERPDSDVRFINLGFQLGNLDYLR